MRWTSEENSFSPLFILSPNTKGLFAALFIKNIKSFYLHSSDSYDPFHLSLLLQLGLYILPKGEAFSLKIEKVSSNLNVILA
ncbi:hypothetical protein [Gracilibacillus alcaliphilus]|uniref:hypothetical protein n=1 Tax=Gracilibacillus alcaliphilus TaxID=1401441 RepID=UPI00195E21BF|nr:hypothetical protein [Gracilibacillus alcaliphilus]MBM7678299.1 hypothetical protein [Gracilibacillus alcaliphilus]